MTAAKKAAARKLDAAIAREARNLAAMLAGGSSASAVIRRARAFAGGLS